MTTLPSAPDTATPSPSAPPAPLECGAGPTYRPLTSEQDAIVRRAAPGWIRTSVCASDLPDVTAYETYFPDGVFDAARELTVSIDDEPIDGCPNRDNPSPSVGGSYCAEVAGHPGVQQDVSPVVAELDGITVWANGPAGSVWIAATVGDPQSLTVDQLAGLAEALLATV